MADSKYQIIIMADPSNANKAIEGVNGTLAKFEKEATRVAVVASKSFDQMAISMAKGVIGGEGIVEMAKKAYETIKEFTVGAVETQAQMGLLAQKVGLTVQEVSALSHAAKMAGVDNETLARGIGFLSKNMVSAAQGTQQQVKHFRDLNVEFKNANGTLRPTMAVLEDIADRFKGMSDGAAKTGLAMQVLGRNGKELIPILNLGGDAIRDMMSEADKLGLVITPETAESAHRFEQNMKALRETVSGLALRLAEDLLPKLIELTEMSRKWVESGGFDKLTAWLTNFLNIVGLVKEAFTDLIKLVTKLIFDVLGLMSKVVEPFVLLASKVMPSLRKEWSAWAATVKDVMTWTNDRGQGFNERLNNFFKVQRQTLPKSREKTGGSDLEIEGGADKEANKLARFSAEANKAAAEFRRSAEESLLDPVTKQIVEAQKEIDKLTQYVDEKGVVHKVQLSARAREDIERGLQMRIQKAQAETAAKHAKEWEKQAQEEMRHAGDIYAKRTELEKELAQTRYEHSRQETEFDDRRLEMRRESALRRLELEEASDKGGIASKISVEARKAGIEIQYAREVHDVKTKLFDAETAHMIDQLQLQRAQLLAQGHDVDRMIRDLEAHRQGLRGQIDEETQAAIDSANENAAIRQYEAVRDQQQKTFDSLKQEAGGVFDALTKKSESVFQAIGNSFKTAILTAVKEVVTSKIAGALMEMFGSGKAAGGSAGLGLAGAAGGMIPMSGLTGSILPNAQKDLVSAKKNEADASTTASDSLHDLSMAASSAARQLGSTASVSPFPISSSTSSALGLGAAASAIPSIGGIASTPPFVGGSAPMGQPGGMLGSIMGQGGQGKGGGLLGNLLGGKGGGGFNLSGMKDFLGITQHLKPGEQGPLQPFGQLSLGGKLSSLGHSGAALMGGMTLAMMGLQRGGVSGLGMDVAGGAMIGFKYGGPLGAAIGGAVGAVAGVARLFIKSAEDKVHDKIKSAYGVDITDKGILTQIVRMVKQSYGGNYDLAIRSQQVVDLVRLYAAQTGQNIGKLPRPMTSTTIEEGGGGQLTRQKEYYLGNTLAPQGGTIPSYQTGTGFVPRDQLAFLHAGERVLPAAENGAFLRMRDSLQASMLSLLGFTPSRSLSFPGTKSQQPAGDTHINISIPGAKDFFQNETVNTVVKNPRAVNRASLGGMRSNFNRRELTAMQLAPGTLTS